MNKQTQKNKRSIRYAILCHIFEHYENSLFCFIAPFIATIFFPDDGSSGAKIGIYFALSAGFLMSPFGAIILSWVGDKYGRRTAVIYAIILSIVPMLTVGILPGYETLGVLSPIILIIARIAQGISIGGAFFATVTFVTEASDPARKNLNLGILLSMGFLGSLIATLLAAFFKMSFMPPYMWRFIFIIGSVYGAALYLSRKSFKESETWKKSEKSTASIPFLRAFVEYTHNIFSVFFFGAGLLMPFYVTMSWLPGYLGTELHFDDSFNLMITSFFLFISGIGTVFFCWLATFLDCKKMLYMSVLLLPIPTILLYMGLEKNSYGILFGCQLAVAVYTALQTAPAFLFIQRLFPLKYKYSGFAIPFALGKASLTATSPFFAEIIIKYTGRPSNVISLLILSSVLVFLGTWLARPLEKEQYLY